MNPALVRRQRVDFIHDHRARGGQRRTARLAGEQDVERFGRSDQDVRRLPPHAAAVGLRRVPGAHQRADLDVRIAERHQLLPDAGQRLLQVAVDVVGQRLERRDVHHARLVAQLAAHPQAHQRIDGGEKGGQRLAGTGGRGDQHVPARLDQRPGLGLRQRGNGVGAPEPVRHRGMERIEDVVHGAYFDSRGWLMV
jgi:hypothetical protein